MSEHQGFTIDTGIKVYFAHPTSPRERGMNENTNGLLLQYSLKETNFTNISAIEIKRVQVIINNRPRAVLNELNPGEVVNNLVALDIFNRLF
jgi:transposase, IS30 family